MKHIDPQVILFLSTAIFVSVVFLHLTKKNSFAVWLYIIQSSSIMTLLLISSVEKTPLLLVIAIIATVLVKIFIGPYFFFNMIKKQELTFTVSTYLNTPMTLLVLAVLVGIGKTGFFKSLTILPGVDPKLLHISISAILISLFLIINRKGAFSQMLGVLSLENCLVSFAILAGLEQNPGLQLGITFNILIWIIIATVFTSMIYNKFGSLDMSEMKHLKE